MHRIVKTAGFMALLTTLLLFGCAGPAYHELNHPYTGPHENQLKDDADLCVKLQDIIDSSYKKLAATKVSCDHYNVLLTGQVSGQDTKDRIGDMIKGQPVVKKYWDYTTINGNPKLHFDSDITKEAQLRIENEENITLEDTQTIAVEGVVYVIGNIKVDEIGNLNKALNGIYSINGVYKVLNLTQITPYGEDYPTNNPM